MIILVFIFTCFSDNNLSIKSNVELKSFNLTYEEILEYNPFIEEVELIGKTKKRKYDRKKNLKSPIKVVKLSYIDRNLGRVKAKFELKADTLFLYASADSLLLNKNKVCYREIEYRFEGLDLSNKHIVFNDIIIKPRGKYWRKKNIVFEKDTFNRLNKSDLKIGKWITYHKRKEKLQLQEEYWNDGELNSYIFKRYLNGKLIEIDEYLFSNGMEIYKKYSEQGKLICESKRGGNLKAGQNILTAYYETGIIKKEKFHIDKSIKGTYKITYSEDGKINTIYNYEKDKIVIIFYNRNGDEDCRGETQRGLERFKHPGAFLVSTFVTPKDMKKCQGSVLKLKCTNEKGVVKEIELCEKDLF